MRLWTKILGLGVVGVAIATAAARPQPPAANPLPAGNKLTVPGDGLNAPRFDAARFIKDHDANKDGKLTKDELPAAAQREFDQIDTNKDGFITQDELQQHAQRMAQQRPQLIEVVFYTIDMPEDPLSLQELQTVYNQLRKLDKNGDGKIDADAVKSFREERKKERIDSIFAVLDRNKDGKISRDEARGLWADNFAQLDKNGDGSLDRSEIEAACAANSLKTSTNPNK